METRLINWLKQNFSASGPVKLGIGDDSAVFDSIDGDMVFSTDSICDGVHFERTAITCTLIGRKALAVNLSDMAAMGARPLSCLVSLMLPRDMTFPEVTQLYEGMRPLVAQFDLSICGGDISVWEGPLAITIAVVGVARGDTAWRIDTAQAGDAIVVTGQFGGSILGRHLRFSPRCEFAMRWADRGIVRAATDASDSLSLDLKKMADASHVGFEIDAKQIPISADARQLGSQPNAAQTPLDHALFDGEDFELIMALRPADVPVMQSESDPDVAVTAIGRFTRESTCNIIDQNGVHPFQPRGFRHGDRG